MRDELLDAQIGLSLVKGIGPNLTKRLEKALGDAVAVRHASVSQLQCVEGVGPTIARQIREGFDQIDLDEQWRLIEQCNAQVIPFDHEDYPQLLKHIPDPPSLLYVRGQLLRTDAVALGIVGSRKCTAYGKEQADRLAAACSQAGLTIISGGARGIDTASHQATLRIGGRTIAVLGCGVNQCYPPENKDLYDRILDNHGAIISELPMNAPPIAEHFPRRNRIISGMSLGVLVIEAANRSGALITARLAAEEHHREVMALPGRVDSQASMGCHRILREGWASLVTNAADILDCLGETGEALRGALDEEAMQQNDNPLPQVSLAGLNRDQLKLIEALGSDTISLDDLAQQANLPIHIIQSSLTMMQLRGLVERLPGNMVRTKHRH